MFGKPAAAARPAEVLVLIRCWQRSIAATRMRAMR